MHTTLNYNNLIKLIAINIFGGYLFHSMKIVENILYVISVLVCINIYCRGVCNFALNILKTYKGF